MSRGERPDLPLFDLPLHGEIEEHEVEPRVPEDDEFVEPEQSRLFEDGSYDPELAPGGEADSEEPDEDDVGVLDRLVGGVVDLAIHVAVLLVVGGASWLMGVRPSPEDWPAFAVFLLLFSLLYTGVPLAFWGQTPGMMRVGHVARTGSGEPLTFGQTARRWLGALLTLALAGLPLLLALGASSRSLADRISGSYTESA